MSNGFLPTTETVPAESAEMVAEAVRRAGSQRSAVYPIGGATALAFGAATETAGLGLSLARLNGLADYPARDLTVTVGAGMTLGELGRLLREENQRLPVDVPQAARATVGGAVATNFSGPRRFRFGTIRDYLLGLTAVDGSGKIFSAGGRVVKNAAGYDLPRLLVGSLGSLAVVTEVTLMVKPVPEASALLGVALADLRKADSLLASLVESEVEPVAIELAAGALPRQSPLRLGDGTAAGQLWLGFEGSEADVRWLVDKAAASCRRHGAEPRLIDGAAEAGELWRTLADFPACNGQPTLTVEAAVRPSQTVAAAESLLKLDGGAEILCHAGDGSLVARFPCPPDRAAALASQAREAVRPTGGKAAVLSAPAESRLDRSAVWGPATEALRVMERIKRKFDPQGILNPGRFIFATGTP